MIHKMKLKDKPFKSIKAGTKTIELRLYDEKRKLLNVGDVIEFTNIDTKEVIKVEILQLHRFNNFDDLYKHFNKISMGYEENEVAKPSDMEEYYSKEEQQEYGVVGIEIKLLK